MSVKSGWVGLGHMVQVGRKVSECPPSLSALWPSRKLLSGLLEVPHVMAHLVCRLPIEPVLKTRVHVYSPIKSNHGDISQGMCTW